MPEKWPIKGLFFSSAIKELKNQNIQSDIIRDYQPLTNYDCHDLILLLDECSRLLWPELSPRATLNKLGSDSVPMVMSNVSLGSIYFKLSQNNVGAAFKLAHRFYNSLSLTQAEVAECGKNYAVMHLIDAWVFPTCYHAGIYQGIIRSMTKANVVATIYEHSICDVYIKCEW